MNFKRKKKLKEEETGGRGEKRGKESGREMMDVGGKEK